MITKKQIDIYGGIGSILTGVACVAIGWMDYDTGRAWHIWAVMTVVLVANGIAMLLHASKTRPEVPSEADHAGGVRVRP